ncbi:unnamed protein product [Trifolium pratense]|uniref:Uncharacterized protein n=1 Tax=Trifolium pratense TaxID=57577 RepID=A0ACB0K2W1_TRIPR|nr:unnamed protein product [Trifolium pratense]
MTLFYYSFFLYLSGGCGNCLLKLGSSIHSKTVKLGLVNDTVVANCLIDMYGKCGSVEHAVCVFSYITDQDVISWNSVIAACANNGDVGLGFKFLKLMPNPDAISYNGLINGLAQAGKIEDTVWILSTMPCPNSSSWNSLITGFVNRNRVHEALDMFSKMHLRNLQMDEFTFSIILNGIAGILVLTWGMLIQCCTVKNLVSWNAMISGYARNGDFVQVTSLFDLLKMERDTKPDGITFLNLISACSHTQIPFEAAIHYFDAMINEYRIAPSVEHCCSVIRLMGQKGELHRAQGMIQELGFQSCGMVWRSLLGACGTQEDLQVAEIAASKLIELERDQDYVYVMLSNSAVVEREVQRGTKRFFVTTSRESERPPPPNQPMSQPISNRSNSSLTPPRRSLRIAGKPPMIVSVGDASTSAKKRKKKEQGDDASTSAKKTKKKEQGDDASTKRKKKIVSDGNASSSAKKRKKREKLKEGKKVDSSGIVEGKRKKISMPEKDTSGGVGNVNSPLPKNDGLLEKGGNVNSPLPKNDGLAEKGGNVNSPLPKNDGSTEKGGNVNSPPPKKYDGSPEKGGNVNSPPPKKYDGSPEKATDAKGKSQLIGSPEKASNGKEKSRVIGSPEVGESSRPSPEIRNAIENGGELRIDVHDDASKLIVNPTGTANPVREMITTNVRKWLNNPKYSKYRRGVIAILGLFLILNYLPPFINNLVQLCENIKKLFKK